MKPDSPDGDEVFALRLRKDQGVSAPGVGARALHHARHQPGDPHLRLRDRQAVRSQHACLE